MCVSSFCVKLNSLVEVITSEPGAERERSCVCYVMFWMDTTRHDTQHTTHNTTPTGFPPSGVRGHSRFPQRFPLVSCRSEELNVSQRLWIDRGAAGGTSSAPSDAPHVSPDVS